MNITALLTPLPFAIATSFTPGPNNLMVAASGVHFGFRRTVPHMIGVVFGFQLLLMAVGLGLGALIAQYPLLGAVLKYGGCAYLIYTAYKMTQAEQSSELNKPPAPMTALSAALFQPLNPKAWIMGLSVMATYVVPGHDHTAQVIIVSVVMGSVGIFAITSWTLFGSMLAETLKSPRAMRIFNWTMAVLLVASLLPVLWH